MHKCVIARQRAKVDILYLADRLASMACGVSFLVGLDTESRITL